MPAPGQRAAGPAGAGSRPLGRWHRVKPATPGLWLRRLHPSPLRPLRRGLGSGAALESQRAWRAAEHSLGLGRTQLLLPLPVLCSTPATTVPTFQGCCQNWAPRCPPKPCPRLSSQRHGPPPTSPQNSRGREPLSPAWRASTRSTDFFPKGYRKGRLPKLKATDSLKERLMAGK